MIQTCESFGAWYPAVQIFLEAFLGGVSIYAVTLVLKNKKKK